MISSFRTGSCFVLAASVLRILLNAMPVEEQQTSSKGDRSRTFFKLTNRHIQTQLAKDGECSPQRSSLVTLKAHTQLVNALDAVLGHSHWALHSDCMPTPVPSWHASHPKVGQSMHQKHSPAALQSRALQQASHCVPPKEVPTTTPRPTVRQNTTPRVRAQLPNASQH